MSASPAVIEKSRFGLRESTLVSAWTRLALERLEARAPGHYGYSVFAIGKADLRKLRDLHVEYLRAMQDIIASSRHSECVAVYASQLLDLSAGPSNALSPQP